jgi:nitrogen fixation NifU-like protein
LFKVYSEKVIERWLNPRNWGKVRDADGFAKIKGPCGDTMQISFKVKDNQIFKIRFLTDGCASTAVTMSVTNMVCEVILEFGTEEQKRRYITLITSGDGYRSILETGRGKPRQLSL